MANCGKWYLEDIEDMINGCEDAEDALQRDLWDLEDIVEPIGKVSIESNINPWHIESTL